MNKMKSFVKEVVAILKGDDAEATGQKILRQADSGLKTQIATLKGDLITLEDAVETAKENLKHARVNHGRLIANRNDYVRELFNAKNAVTDAQEALELHQAKINFLQEELSLLDKEE